MRAGLAALGVGPGDRVGIIANNRLEWAAMAYGCYGLGAALVPMYESQHEKEWAFIARDAGCKLLFAGNRAIHDKLAALRASIPTLKRLVLLDPAAADEQVDDITRYPQLVELRPAAAGGRRAARRRTTSPACCTPRAPPATPRAWCCRTPTSVRTWRACTRSSRWPPTTGRCRSCPGPTPSATPSSCT